MNSNKKFFVLLALCIFFIISGAIVGCQQKKSHEKAPVKVEYASQTDNKFYKKMVDMERGSEIVFDGFPTCLVDAFNALPGDEILVTRKDTVSFVSRYFSRDNVNNYPFYVIKDNHGNVWIIYRSNETFRLIRENEDLIKGI